MDSNETPANATPKEPGIQASSVKLVKSISNSLGGTDSSDIEIIQDEHDSSESIEVLDPEKNADTQSVNTLTAGLEGSGEVSPANTQDNVNMPGIAESLQKSFTKEKGPSQLDPKPSATTMDTNADLMQKLLVDMSLHQRQTLPSSGHDIHHVLPAQGMCYENIYDSSDYPSGSNAQSDEELVANGGISRPDSLSLPKPLHYYEKKRKIRREISESSMSTSSSVDALIEEVSKTPLSKQGTVIQEGGMMEFIADDLTNMIKMSSPLSRKGDSGSGSQTPSGRSVSSVSSSTSGWSSSSASGWSYSGMSRSPSILTASPEDIPPIDPRALMELEVQAQQVAGSLDHMLGTLRNNLHKMSSLTYYCLDAYKDGVDNTCDSVDTSIKSMYAMMAKCEELSKSMQPVYKIHSQIKDISRVLEAFEACLKKGVVGSSKK